MSFAFAETGLLERALNWIFGAWPKAQTAEVGRPREAAFVVPMLFASRVSQSGAMDGGVINVVSIARMEAWRFAARLRSVAAANVPKALKGRRQRPASPAGKAIPKRKPRVLKSCKTGSGVPAQAPWRRESQAPIRHSNVVALPVSKPRTIQKACRTDRLAA